MKRLDFLQLLALSGRISAPLFWWLLVLGTLLGCRSVRTEYIPVETKTVETVTVVDTVQAVPLPSSRDSVSLPDTVSYLHNAFAYSWARYSGGLLSHSLGILPGASMVIRVPHYEVRTRYVERPVIQVKEVEVERKLTRWQSLKIRLGECFVLLILLLSGYIVYLKRKGGSQ
jgi:hypothetical protein